MSSFLEFVQDNLYMFLTIGFIFLFFTIREIIRFIRLSHHRKLTKQEIIESEKRLKSLLGQLNQNRQTLLRNLQDISEEEKRLSDQQPPSPSDPNATNASPDSKDDASSSNSTTRPDSNSGSISSL